MNLEELKKVVEKSISYGERIGEEDWVDKAFLDQYFDPEDRDFIATFNPSLVSKLLRVVEAAKEMEAEGCLHLSDGLESVLRDLEQS